MEKNQKCENIECRNKVFKQEFCKKHYINYLEGYKMITEKRVENQNTLLVKLDTYFEDKLCDNCLDDEDCPLRNSDFCLYKEEEDNS
jgi:hypothetical protein